MRISAVKTMSRKLFGSQTAVKLWGEAEPRQLLEMFSYLNSKGFKGPTRESNLHFFSFKKKINNDLSFDFSISHLYCDPQHVFNFHCSLSLSSKSVYPPIVEMDLYDGEIPTPGKDLSIGVVSMPIAHLKWDAEGGEINPTWQISTLKEYENCVQIWINDWEKYVEPILRTIIDNTSAWQFCEKALQYKRNPWVKSNGYLAANLEISTALLMLNDGLHEQAINLLLSESNKPLKPAHKIQLQKAIDWIRKRIEQDR
jgi:hypothetical protein